MSIPYDVAPVFAVYSTELSIASSTSNIFYRQTQNSNIVAQITKITSLKPDNVVVVTFKNVESAGSSSDSASYVNSFQVILAYNDAKTYGIVYYDRLDTQGATVGWSSPGCSWKLLRSPGDSVSMVSTSNVKEMGKHVFLLHYSEMECSSYKGKLSDVMLK